MEWFNQVDATYRSDLREMNEQNFARFDARLEQRLAELRSDLRGETAALDKKMDVGFANLKLAVEHTMREQTRWFIAASGALAAAQVALIALIIGLWTRLP